jgi:hypothetical protein
MIRDKQDKFSPLIEPLRISTLQNRRKKEEGEKTLEI